MKSSSPLIRPHSERSKSAGRLMRLVFLSVLSGLFLNVAFPNAGLSCFAWFALVPVLFVIARTTPGLSFRLSYIFGLVFLLGTLQWLTNVTLLGYFALSLFLAIFFALFGLVSNCVLKVFRTGYRETLLVFILPSLWVTLEFIRSIVFTGFPWAILGHTQYRHPVLIQIADLTGAYGVSFFIVMVNTVLYLFIAPFLKYHTGSKGDCLKEFFRLRWVASIFIIFLIAVCTYGYYSLLNERDIKGSLKIAVIQGNIEQEKKWDPAYKEFILSRYFDLTRQASKETPDLIIWPETSLPGYLDDSDIFMRIKELLAEISAPILLGAVTYDFLEKDGVYFNSSILLSKEDFIVQKYDKMHLVPFGEYIPFESHIPFFRDFIDVTVGDFRKGSTLTPFNIYSKDGGMPFKCSTLICFEDIFPYLTRLFVKEGADFIINMTNDAWFKKSAEQMQHVQSSVFRAVESRRSLVRCANTGFSCYISEKGVIKDSVNSAELGMYIDEFKVFNINISKAGSLYSHFGDIFAFLCVISTVLALGYAIVRGGYKVF